MILLPGLSDCSGPENKDLQQEEKRITFVKPNSGFKVACKKKKRRKEQKQIKTSLTVFAVDEVLTPGESSSCASLVAN